MVEYVEHETKTIPTEKKDEDGQECEIPVDVCALRTQCPQVEPREVAQWQKLWSAQSFGRRTSFSPCARVAHPYPINWDEWEKRE